MRQSKADKYREIQTSNKEPETLTLEEFAAKLVDGGRKKKKEERSLNPTQKDVIYSNAKINAYMGAAGAAKTSSICAAGWMRALFQPGSKGVVARHDYNKLLMTTKATMENMLHLLPPGTLLGRDKSPPETWIIKPIIDGPPSTIYFMGLKDEVVGFEIDWCAIDEANEVEEKRVLELIGRLRNMIPGMPDDVDPTGMYLAFNPPDSSHWLYTACTGLDAKGRFIKKPWMKLFTPQYKENARNLRKGYYEEMEEKYPEDLRDRFVRGLWGTTFPGTPVYRQFNHATHVKRDLPHDIHSILYRFWDFGYNAPACIWAQIDLCGRMLVLHELIGSKVEIQDFAKMVKAEQSQKFHGQQERVVDFGDPAVRQKKDTGSTLSELVKVGITINFKISLIDTGVRLIRTQLNQMIEGEPAMQFDELGVPVLINAMKGGYRMNDAGTEPKKDNFYDHPADAFRYGCINLLGGEEPGFDVGSLPGNVGYDGAYS